MPDSLSSEMAHFLEMTEEEYAYVAEIIEQIEEMMPEYEAHMAWDAAEAAAQSSAASQV